MSNQSRPSAERLARVALSAVGEPGDLRLANLLQDHDASEVWESLRQQRVCDGIGKSYAETLETLDPGALLSGAQAKGIRFVIPGDEEWPENLTDLGFAPPLHHRGGLPVGLWLRGTGHLAEIASRSVAIVGSRSATTYGAEVARMIAAELAERGFHTVSGAAFGIDQAAHRGSLGAGANTVALLACGVDRAYPAAHASLLDWIAEHGVVVSEAPPGSAPTKIRFLARNRLIAAISRGVLVTEAALRSGALNSANWGVGLGRPVMATPGPVTSATSVGAHQLVRAKGAALVTNGAEVLELVGEAGEFTLDFPRATEN